MGELNNFWADPAVENFGKCLIFRAIPCNLLLWGCESWASSEATMKKLEVFLHRNIRKILKMDIAKVIEERITNISIRERFFDIPTIRNQIAHRQLTFIVKVVRNPDEQIPTQLLTAWCNHKRKPGGVLQNITWRRIFALLFLAPQKTASSLRVCTSPSITATGNT